MKTPDAGASRKQNKMPEIKALAESPAADIIQHAAKFMLFNHQAQAAGTASRVDDAADAVQQLVHELRKPLRSIGEIAYYLDMALPLADARSRRQLLALQRQIRHARWILDDAVTPPDAEPLRLSTVDLREVISNALTGWQAEDTAWLVLDLEQDLPLVKADIGQIEQLIRRPVLFVSADARRATRLRCRACDGSVAIELTPPGRIEFPPTLIAPSAGPGMALASARRIIDRHGGRVEVERSAEQVTLRIILPAA